MCLNHVNKERQILTTNTDAFVENALDENLRKQLYLPVSLSWPSILCLP